MASINVFICYRRADTQDFAGRLAERLKRCPKIGKVFIDADGIRAGDKFSDRITAELEGSDICFVIVGTRWLDATPGGHQRLFDEDDLVRREIQQALKVGCKIIPVLANQAMMPQPVTLPSDIRAFAGLNGIGVDHTSFERDFADLCKQAGLGDAEAHSSHVPFVQIAGGALGALVAAFAFALLHFAIFHVSLSTSLGGDVRVGVLIVVAMVFGAMAPWLWRRASALYRG